MPATHASLSAQRASGKGQKMKEQYLDTLPTPLAFYDPKEYCWRMSQGTLLSEVSELLPKLPDWGMSAAGALYELATPEPLTVERDFLSGRNLPTPGATDDIKPRPQRVDKGRYDLVDMIGTLAMENLLPTPTARDYKDISSKGPQDLLRMFPVGSKHATDTLPKAIVHQIFFLDPIQKQSDDGKE